jgi:hypothetical protein
MTRKHNNKGRSTSDGKFIQLGEWLMKSEAWRQASVFERSLYIEIKRRYNGSNNGDVPLSHREAQDLLGCSNRPVLVAFRGLQKKGFIKARVRGSFNWKASADGVGRSTRWELTEYPLDVPIRVLSGGTKDFLRWGPSADEANKQKKSRCALSIPMVCAEHTISANIACAEHTIREPAYAYGTR